MKVQWNKFNYKDKSTAPPEQEMVWIIEEYAIEGVRIGIFDGNTMRLLASGTDDCSVSHWAKIDYPEAIFPNEWGFLNELLGS